MKKSIIFIAIIVLSVPLFSQSRFARDSTFYKLDEALKKPLRVVDLSINERSNFYSMGILDSFPNLRGVSFEDITIENTEGLFSYLTRNNQIEELELYNCEIDSVHLKIGRLDKLQSLTVYGIDSVDLDVLIFQLSSLDSFEEIDLSEQSLTEIPQSLQKLKGLKKLWMSENKVTYIPEFIKRMPNLEVLDLFANEINQIEVDSLGFQKLKWIDLCYNHFTIFPTSLFALPSLEKITIWYNEIDSIPDLELDNYSVKELNLLHNNLTTLPRSITKLKKLEFLDLGFNELSYESIRICYELFQLKNLELRDNNLSRIPAGVSALNGLESLSLSNNPLIELPDDLCDLRHLIQIGLGNMQTMNWKKCFTCLGQVKSLRKIGIFRMGITSLPDEFKLLSQVDVFWMGQNRFTKEEKNRITTLFPNSEFEF